MLDNARTKMRLRRNSTTDVIILLDASGSMLVRRSETIREVNRYLDRLKNDGLKYRLTVKTFNDSVENLIYRKDIQSVGELEPAEYRPNGWTRLLDAVGDSLDYGRDGGLYGSERTLFVVITDGQENASRRYGLQQVRDMIDNRRSENFQFVFLGDGPQAWQVGRGLGFNISVATDWTSPRNTMNIYDAVYTASNSMALNKKLDVQTFTTGSTNATNTTPKP